MNDKKNLDITKFNCPITFVKTKIFLEHSNQNINRNIQVKGKVNLQTLCKTLCDENYKIKTEEIKKNIYNICILKSDQ